MTSNANKPAIEVVFVAEGTDGPDVEYRTKRFLKHALRAHGLRCLSARHAGQCPGCEHSRELIQALAEKLSTASAVLSRAAERLSAAEKREVAEQCRQAKSEAAAVLKRIALTFPRNLAR